jgi:hypothetical protein
MTDMRKHAGCAQVRLSDPAQYQSIVDAEWNIIYAKLQKCADSGAKVVLSRLAIGDLGTQFFADRDIFCAGRVRHCFLCSCMVQEMIGFRVWLGRNAAACSTPYGFLPAGSRLDCPEKPRQRRALRAEHVARISKRRQVPEEDLKRVAAATGAAVQTTVNGLDAQALGTCAHFEEVQVRARAPN